MIADDYGLTVDNDSTAADRRLFYAALLGCLGFWAAVAGGIVLAVTR